MSEKTKPEQTFGNGAIKVPVWKNTATTKEGIEFTRLNAVPEKSYKDGENWKKTTSFKKNEIPELITYLQQAYEYMLAHK